MKTTIVALLLGVCSIANAYEIQGNPDQRASIGFSFDHLGAKSDWEYLGSKQSDFTKISENDFLLDLRLPMNRTFTLSVRGGFRQATNDVFTGEKIETKGNQIGFTLRAYLP